MCERIFDHVSSTLELIAGGKLMALLHMKRSALLLQPHNYRDYQHLLPDPPPSSSYVETPRTVATTTTPAATASATATSSPTPAATTDKNSLKSPVKRGKTQAKVTAASAATIAINPSGLSTCLPASLAKRRKDMPRIFRNKVKPDKRLQLRLTSDISLAVAHLRHHHGDDCWVGPELEAIWRYVSKLLNYHVFMSFLLLPFLVLVFCCSPVFI